MATNKSYHLKLEDFLALADGARPSPATTSHLGTCSACAQSLAETKTIRASLHASRDLVDPPASVLARAIDLFPQRPSFLERVAIRVREIVLETGDAMLAPSCGKLAFSGVRGHLDPNHYRFFGEDVEVDLELTDERLTGQVVFAVATQPAVTAWIERGSKLPGYETPVGSDGMFHFEAIPEAPFDLVIDRVEERLRVHVAPRAS